MSRRALELLALAVTALAVVALLDRPAPAPGALPDRLFPGLDARNLARVEVTGPGRAPLVIERDGDGFRVGAHPADSDAVAELTGALELLAYRRRVPAAAAAERGLANPRLSLRMVERDGAERRLEVGAAEPLLGRTWVSVGNGWHDLVDGYAVRALERSPDELRQRAPFAGHAARRVALAAGAATVVLRGDPLCVELDGGCAAADRARAARLIARLGELTLDRFTDAAPSAQPRAAAPPGAPEPRAAAPSAQPRAAASPGASELRVAVDDAWLEVAPGACADARDERPVRSSLGAGCVAAAALGDLVADAASGLAWVEPSPLALAGGAVDRVEVGGLVLERRGGGWHLGGAGAEAGARLDGEAVRGWLDGLASFRGRVESAPAPAAPPGPGVLSATLFAGGQRERLVVTAGPDGARVRRDDEPVVLVVHPGLRALLAADRATFADRSVLGFEPSALAEIVAEGPGGALERAVRGASGERFTLVAPLALDAEPAAIAAVRDLASHLRAARVAALARTPADGLDPPRRRLTFITDAPPGTNEPPGRHVLELGAPAPEGGCRAARAGEATVYVLAPASCAVLEAPLAARQVFRLAADEVSAVAAPGVRAERHAGLWYGADGARLAPEASAAASSWARLLAVAPAVTGYGALGPGAAAVTLLGPRGPVALHVGHGVYALDGRPVRYELPVELCPRVPDRCR
jgi:hypothetical protein